ncbi:MAG: helix-turn-helix domain-containing protein [Thermus sp.]|uniref:helix-turn-helix domain-containing protein n=1 Tax=Thermus sp. TaxID=275 RepID=UPI003D0A3FA1
MEGNLSRLAYNVREAAEALRVSETTVWRLIRSGALRAARLGRRVIIPHAALEALLEGEGNAVAMLGRAYGTKP